VLFCFRIFLLSASGSSTLRGSEQRVREKRGLLCRSPPFGPDFHQQTPPQRSHRAVVPLPRGNVGPLPLVPLVRFGGHCTTTWMSMSMWTPPQRSHHVVYPTAMLQHGPTTLDPTIVVPPLSVLSCHMATCIQSHAHVVVHVNMDPPQRSHNAVYPTATSLRGSTFIALHSKKTRAYLSYHYTRPICAQPRFLFLTTARGPGF
jgi:hypothetical protein